jgi:hypothetical protein
MVWTIDPRQSAYTSIDMSQNYGGLTMSTVGTVKLRYNNENYTLQKVKCHLPVGYAKEIAQGGVAEISCLFTVDDTNVRKYIRWIFPILMTSDDSVVTLGLKSWFTTNADAKPLVQSFEDMLPDTIQYIQWSDCFTGTSSTSQSTTNILTTCYSINPLYIRSGLLQTGKLYSYEGEYTGTDEQKRKRGIATASEIAEPYTYILNTSPFDVPDVESRFAVYIYRTGRVKQKTKQKKLAKCFAVNLDRDMDANGLINVDSTGTPLDPATVQALQGSGPQDTLNAVNLEAIEKQKETTNKVIFWGSIGLFGLLGLAAAIWAIFYWLPARKTEASILESAATLAELSKASPLATAVAPVAAVPIKLPTDRIAALAAAAAVTASAPAAAAGIGGIP